jgi:hypothetical protein
VKITIVMMEQQPGPQKQNRGIRSLNKMQEEIIKGIIEPKGVLSKWCNGCGVLVRKKCKII